MQRNLAIDYAISALIDRAQVADEANDLYIRAACIKAAATLADELNPNVPQSSKAAPYRADENPPVPIDSEMPCRGGPAPSDWKGPKQTYAATFRNLWEYAETEPTGANFCNETRRAAEIAFAAYAGAGPHNPITECVAAVILRRILRLDPDFPLPHPAVRGL